MITSVHIPPPPLGLFVEHLFYYTGYTPEHSLDRFLPDGNVQLIFDLTDTPKSIHDNESLEEVQTCRRVWFSGFRTCPITIPSGRQSEMLIVQFKKGRASAFLKAPMQEMTNEVVDAEWVMGREVLEVRERLLEASGPAEKLRLAAKLLDSGYLQDAAGNPMVDFAVSAIERSPDTLSIQAVARSAGYSQKHMIQLFKQQVGVTPKEFLRVLRFQRAIGEIEARLAVNWSEVALDCGYFDQSHFIADFRKFSGFTPKRYLDLRGEALNYIPVA